MKDIAFYIMLIGMIMIGFGTPLTKAKTERKRVKPYIRIIKYIGVFLFLTGVFFAFLFT